VISAMTTAASTWFCHCHYTVQQVTNSHSAFCYLPEPFTCVCHYL